ncbi:hypothetical protein N2152v2_009538 [Parachlorella kessleri]
MPSAIGDVSVTEAQELTSSGVRRYLDVRTPEEFGGSHPAGAVNIPLLLSLGGTMQPNADFLKQLAAAGYTDLVNMSGGFDAWLAAGFPKAGGTPAAAQLVRISTQEGQGLIEKGATYLDVRTPEEYAAGHAPSAVHVPVAVNVDGVRQQNADFVAQVRAAVPDTSTPLCVACMGGARAETAAKQLLEAGYTDVKQMVDGFKGWTAIGLPVQKGSSGAWASQWQQEQQQHHQQQQQQQRHQQQRGFLNFIGLNGDVSKTYNERKLIGYSPRQMYDVVAAVDHYHLFVPWCVRSTVTLRRPTYLEAELEVGFQMFVERYTSMVTLHPPTRVESRVENSTLFHHLHNKWDFRPGPSPATCWLTFDVDFAFKSPLYRQIASVFFEEVVQRMMGAFEGRCRQLYGPSSLHARVGAPRRAVPER